jgi:O-antigen/teichoic acid export membrane protein
MRNALSKLSLGWNLRDLGTLTGGSILSQVSIVIFTIIVSRLYSATEFGFYALSLGLAVCIAPVLTKSLESFIVTTKNDSDAIYIARLAFISLLRNLIVISLIIFSISRIADRAGFEALSNFVFFESSLLLGALFGLYSVFNSVVLRLKRFGLYSLRGFVQNSSIGIAQSICSIFNLKHYGLMLGEFIGRIITLAYLLPTTIKFLSKGEKFSSGAQIDHLDRRKRLYNFAAIFLELVCFYLPLYWVAQFFDKDSAGQLAMAQRVLSAPIFFLSANIGVYLLSVNTQRSRNDDHYTRFEFRNALKKLFVLGLIASFLLGTLGPLVLSAILGPKWSLAGELVRVLSVTLAFSFVWNALSSQFYVNELWGKYLLIIVLRLLAILLSVSFSIFFKLGLLEGMLLLYLSNTLVQLVGLFIVDRRLS